MNKIISKDTTSLYVDGWLAEFLFFDGENITFKKAHGTDIGKVFKIPLSDWSTDEYGLSYETKEYKDKKVIEAFNAYKKAKEVFVKEVAEKWKSQIDERAYEALMKYTVEITD